MISSRSFGYRVLGLVVTVATLAAFYFFLIRPVLDTTNRAIDQAGEITRGFGPAIEQATDVSPQIERTVRRAQRLQQRQQAASAARIGEANRMLDCMRRAGGDVEAVQRCSKRFAPN